MIANGTFASGLTSWTLFGQISGAVNAGVFEFIRLAGNPAGVILQATGQAVTANQILTATFQLGNSSPVRKRVTVIVHDNDFSDLSACTFWLEPGQALSNYTYRTFATEAWTNATFSVYGATVGSEASIRLDNVSLKRTPGTSIIGTECLEPGSADMAGVPPPAFAASGLASPGATGGSPAASEPTTRDVPTVDGDASGWTAAGFDESGQGVWTATAGIGESKTLEFASDLDLSSATAAELSFTSTRSGTGRAEVQVAVDDAWETVALVAGSDAPMPVQVDLSAYAGRTIRLRLVLIGGHPADEWRVGDLTVNVH